MNSLADAIWNRACDHAAQLQRPGDRALQAVLISHGQIMNSGLYSAMYSNTFEELAAAARGFDFFERSDVADVLRQAADAVFPNGPIGDADARERHVDDFHEQDPERLAHLEDAYQTLVPRDDALDAIFRERLSSSPQDFAPLD